MSINNNIMFKTIDMIKINNSDGDVKFLPEYDKDKYELYLVNLKDFPHDATSKRTNPSGKNGPINFYTLNKKVKVAAYDELKKEFIWADVSLWSYHPKRKLEIVTLSNGVQIFTDDDDRAIYGKLPDKDEFIRTTPTKAKELNLFIPCKKKLWQQNKDKSQLCAFPEELYPIELNDINDCIYLQYVLRNYCNVNTRVTYDKDKKNYYLIKESESEYKDPEDNDCFVTIKSIEYTDKYEDGYDLTVPGYETFMSSDGVVLSNTVNIHVPALPEAQEEVKKKLMPSKQVLSIRDYNNIYNPFKQDYILGLSQAVKDQNVKTYKFNSIQEALQAIRSGKVNYNDNIEIPD